MDNAAQSRTQDCVAMNLMFLTRLVSVETFSHLFSPWFSISLGCPDFVCSLACIRKMVDSANKRDHDIQGGVEPYTCSSTGHLINEIALPVRYDCGHSVFVAMISKLARTRVKHGPKVCLCFANRSFLQCRRRKHSSTMASDQRTPSRVYQS